MRLYRYYSKITSSGRVAVTPVSQSVVVSKVSDSSIIENGLSPIQDTTVFATGHYYVDLNTSKYTTGTLYKAVWTFVLVASHTQTATEYFNLQHVVGPITDDEFLSTLNQTLDVYRPTDNVLDTTPVATSLTPDRNPPESSRLRVTLDHSVVASASVTIAGSTNETVSITNGNRGFETTKFFTSISGITTGGITGGTIQVEALDRVGNPILQENLAMSALSVYFWHPMQRVGQGREEKPSGDEELAKYRILTPGDAGIRVNDIVYAGAGIDGLTRGRIDLVEYHRDHDGNAHHIEAEIIQL